MFCCSFLCSEHAEFPFPGLNSQAPISDLPGCPCTQQIFTEHVPTAGTTPARESTAEEQGLPHSHPPPPPPHPAPVPALADCGQIKPPGAQMCHRWKAEDGQDYRGEGRVLNFQEMEAGGVRDLWQKDPEGTASCKDPGRHECLGLRVRAEV